MIRIREACRKIKTMFKGKTSNDHSCLENKLADILYVVGLIVGDEIKKCKSDLTEELNKEIKRLKEKVECHRSILNTTLETEDLFVEELTELKKDIAKLTERLIKLENDINKNKLKGC